MALKGDRIIRYVLFLVVMVATIYFLYLVREVLLSFLIGGNLLLVFSLHNRGRYS
jgi:hypothetical protein